MCLGSFVLEIELIFVFMVLVMFLVIVVIIFICFVLWFCVILIIKWCVDNNIVLIFKLRFYFKLFLFIVMKWVFFK